MVSNKYHTQDQQISDQVPFENDKLTRERERERERNTTTVVAKLGSK